MKGGSPAASKQPGRFSKQTSWRDPSPGPSPAPSRDASPKKELFLTACAEAGEAAAPEASASERALSPTPEATGGSASGETDMLSSMRNSMDASTRDSLGGIDVAALAAAGLLESSASPLLSRSGSPASRKSNRRSSGILDRKRASEVARQAAVALAEETAEERQAKEAEAHARASLSRRQWNKSGQQVMRAARSLLSWQEACA